MFEKQFFFFAFELEERVVNLCTSSFLVIHFTPRKLHPRLLLLTTTMDIRWQTLLMLLQTALFILAWRYLHDYIRTNGPIRGASRVTKINSILYAIASLALLILILSPSHESVAQQLYHASKFYEYVDIFNVRASGGIIDLHFGFHHLTTCYLTFIRVIHNSEGWKPFAALNAFHHSLMYAYFGGVQFPRPVLPWTGALQLIVGMAADIWVMKGKLEAGEGDVWPNVVSGCLLAAYLVLSTRELLMRREQQRAASMALREETKKGK